MPIQAYSDGLNPHLFSPESPNGGTKNGMNAWDAYIFVSHLCMLDFAS